jgi:glutamate dehydrogenase/leucine dehydrogenase
MRVSEGDAKDMFRFADQLGPEKVIHLHEPRVGLKAIVVVDNTAAGPAIGGTRMARDVSVEESSLISSMPETSPAARSKELRSVDGSSVR